MARFDVYRNRDGELFVDVRSDHVQDLRRLVLVPILPHDHAPRPHRDINPLVTFDGQQYVLMTHHIASVPRQHFRQATGNMTHAWDDITRALDFLLTGF